MYRKIFLSVIIAFIAFLIQADPARAAPQLEVKAEIGVNNTIKMHQPLPLKLTITNNGSSFSGDLVIDAAPYYSVGSAQVYPLDVAEGETKTITLYLDGITDDYAYNSQNESLFSFYEGGIEKGKPVDFSGDKKIRFRYFFEGDTPFIFTYTENTDRLAALLRLSQYTQNNNVQIFHLNQIPGYEFPTNYKGLAMADLFVVDEMNLADLSQEQQQAIFDWVKDGGILLIGASEQVERSVGIFREYLPLDLSREKVTVSKEALSTLSKGGMFTEDIQVFRAAEREGSNRILANGDTILASSISLGKGQIIQTTFSLGDQPLSTMDGYGKLLNEIVQMQKLFSKWNGNFYDSLSYELREYNELFPSFKVHTPIIIITIVLYMVFVGPVLYLLLKKADRREHAWWIIPVFSVALTLLMFLIGAKDRIMESQINQSAFYKVEGNNLSGYYVESILTNRGGDYVLQTDENTSAYAKVNNSVAAQGRLHEKSYVKTHGNGSELHLRNVNYWSVQSVVGETKIPDAGNFEIDLTVKDSKIEGTVKNNFPFLMKDVSIWSGSQEIEIGDIQPNETIKVSKPLKNSILLKPNTYFYNWNPPKDVEDLIPKRIEYLKYGVLNLLNDNQPVLVGWAEEALVGIQLEGSAKISPVAVIAQSFQPKMELEGEFTVNQSMMATWVIPVNGGYAQIVNEVTNEWQMGPGEYEYYVAVPEELFNFNKDFQLTELTIKNREKNRITVSLWNNKTNLYEELQDKELNWQGDLKPYISENHEIKMFIQVANNVDGSPIQLPRVEMKGVANND